MTNWYQLPHKTALCLILIIMRSSNVIKITAGKLVHLSIATFGDVSNIHNYSLIIISDYFLMNIKFKCYLF